MKALIDGFYGHSNLGDDLILISLLDLLTGYGTREATVVLRGADAKLIDRISRYSSIKVTPLHVRGMANGLLHILPAVLRHDLIVIGGGGLFPKDSWKGHLARLLPLMWGKITGRITLLLGVTVDPIDAWFTKVVWKAALHSTDAVVVRDAGSRKNLTKIAAPKRIHCGRDLVFRFPNAQVFPHTNPIADEPFVILAPANIFYAKTPPQQRGKYERFVSDWVDIANWFTKREFKVVLIPFYHPFDTSLCKDIKTRSAGGCTVTSEHNDIEKRVKLFAKAQFAVGMRYHSIVLSLKHLVPFCAVIYDYKTKWLLAELGLEHLAAGSWGLATRSHLRVNVDLDLGLLTSKMEMLLATSAGIKSQLTVANNRIMLDMRAYEKLNALIRNRYNRNTDAEV